MVRAHRVILRTAVVVLAVGLLAVLAACGSSGSADPESACATTHAALAPPSAARTKASAAAAAKAAGDAFSALNLAVAGLGGPSPNPEALANLRNAANIAALDYHDLAALLVQPGSGLLGPLRVQAIAAYAQIDQAAAQLGTPGCSADNLGRALFAALVARTTAPAGPNLTIAAQAACTNIVAAYGTSQVAIDERAALTQLERSAAVLDAARNDLTQVTGPAGAGLRAALDQAVAVLNRATGEVGHGASPSTTTIRAFAQASALLRTGFRSAGVGCQIPGS